MSAISNNSLNMIESLVDNGADLKLVNKDKNTALHLAFINRHESSAKYILDKTFLFIHHHHHHHRMGLI